MDDEYSNSVAGTQSNSDRIKLNVGGKVFETTISTLQSGGSDSLLSILSSSLNHRDPSLPVFIDRDPEIFSALLSLLRSNRLPSAAAKRFSNQELVEEAAYYGIESQLRSALAPPPLSGIDASIVTTITPFSGGIVSDFNAVDSDGSVWLAHGGQVSVYDWNLTHTATVRTHLDHITSIRRISSHVSAIGSDSSSGLHFYSMTNGRRVSSVEWSDPTDPRIYKAKVHAIADSDECVFASFDCQHRENSVLLVDKDTMKIVSEVTRQPGNSSKGMVATKLKYLQGMGILVGVSITSGAFGYSGYIRLWDPRSKEVIWETHEPGSARSGRYGDSFADVDVDMDEMALVKLCSKSGDLAVADLRNLSQDPWIYLKEKNPSMRRVNGGLSGGNCNVHCYKKQFFVGREGELEVWSRVEDENNSSTAVRERDCLSEDSYRRNYVDKLADSERGAIAKIEGGGDRLFVTREEAEGIEVWQSSHLSGGVSLL